MFLEWFFYGLVLTTMIFSHVYIMALLMLMVVYDYSYWIIKECLAMLALTIQKITRIELMKDSSLHNGSKFHPLIPCSYLNPMVLEGTHGREGKTQLYGNCGSEKIYSMILDNGEYGLKWKAGNC